MGPRVGPAFPDFTENLFSTSSAWSINPACNHFRVTCSSHPRDRSVDCVNFNLELSAWLDDPAYPVSDDVRSVLESAAAALRQAGARILDVRPPITLPDAVALHMELVYPLMEPSSKLLPRAWLAANERREQLRAAMADFFGDVDALLMPVAVVPAIPHDHSEPLARRQIPTDGGSRPYLDMFGWVGLATVAYLPATVVPVGRTPAGLPVGIQIVGPYLEDRTTLEDTCHSATPTRPLPCVGRELAAAI